MPAGSRLRETVGEGSRRQSACYGEGVNVWQPGQK